MAEFRIRRVVIHDGAPDGGFLAVATVEVSWGLHEMLFRGFRVIARKDGTGEMLAMPSRKNSRGSHVEIIRLLNDETRQLFEDAILGEYKRCRELANDRA